MKRALAFLLLSCVLVAQDKPAAKAPKPAAAEKPAEAKPKIPPINVRDELIELIHQLKKEVTESPIADYEAKAKSKNEAQRLLLQALVELAKEAEKKEPTKAYHSSNPTDGYVGF